MDTEYRSILRGIAIKRKTIPFTNTFTNSLEGLLDNIKAPDTLSKLLILNQVISEFYSEADIFINSPKNKTHP